MVGLLYVCITVAFCWLVYWLATSGVFKKLVDRKVKDDAGRDRKEWH
tara:strand:- start:742 stop:882 length:141 start_codon:yes stop_codon:yes gene_type:complete